MELGKTIWKGVVVPRVMYGLTGISVKKKHVESLDKWQGMVYRSLLRVQWNTPKEFYLQEIGSSSFSDRISKAKISFGKETVLW